MAYDANQLLAMSQTELDDLFRASPRGPDPERRRPRAPAIIAPGTSYSMPIATVINHFGWQGKVFDAEKGVLEEPPPRVRPRGDRRQGLQDAELARQQGVHRPRLLRDVARGALHSRRDPSHRPGLLPRQGVLGQGSADRLLPEVLSHDAAGPLPGGRAGRGRPEAGPARAAALDERRARDGRPAERRRARSAQFERLHFARLVAARRRPAGRPARARRRAARACRPASRFLGDCDGPADEVLADLAQRAGPGLARDLRALRRLRRPAPICSPGCARTISASAASFVNWVGRSVRQIREESALQRALAARVPRRSLAAPGEARAGPRASSSPGVASRGRRRPAGADTGRADAARLAARQARQPGRGAAGRHRRRCRS